MPILIPDIFKGPMEYLQAEEILRRLFDRIKCEDYQGPMGPQWMTNPSINGTRFNENVTPFYPQTSGARRKRSAIWLKAPGARRAYASRPQTSFEAVGRLAN